MWRFGGRQLLLLWVSMLVPPSLLQPPSPLSLPVQMSVFPPPWQFLPLARLDPDPLFSNSSPFSSSQSFFVLPRPSQAPAPVLQASFGPYSVTQLVSEPVPPASPWVHAALLSGNVQRERDEAGKETLRVRVLFHKRDAAGTHGTCIILHAFKETEQHKSSCFIQPPLGLCLATLTLPSDWLTDQEQLADQSQADLNNRYGNVRRHRQAETRQRGQSHHGNVASHRHATSSSLRSHPKVDKNADPPRGLRRQQDPGTNQIQLYYSAFSAASDLKPSQQRCEEDSGTQSQMELFHIRAVSLGEQQEDSRTESGGTEQDCLNGQQEEVLNVDSHVVVRYHRGPVVTGQPIRVSVNLRANISSHFVAIRMKVKRGLVSTLAQRDPDPDPWTVTVERSQSFKHDVMSIISHKQASKKHHSSSVLQQVACLSVDGLRRSFDVAMTVSAQWWAEYSGRGKRLSPRATAASQFSFADRHILGIVPVTESTTIINTAILTSQPVSLPVTVLAVGQDEKVSDVTSAVSCRSASEDAVKVSSDCSLVFVDGSESALGSTCAKVEFLLGMLSGSLCLEVWAPTVPLQVSLGDPVLNAIDGWNLFTEEGCVPVYQRSTVQVLTRFTAQDAGGRTRELLGTSDRFVDVTELIQDLLRVDDPQVASLGPQNVLVGLRPGRTSLQVVSERDGVLARGDLAVTSDVVVPGDLSVQVVSGLGVSVSASPAHPSVVTATVTAHNILYDHHQEASISVWLQFSDDTAALLSGFGDLPHFLRLSSLAETVVVVSPSPGQRILAQGEGGGPLLQAELLVSTCTEQLVTSNSIGEWTDSQTGRRTRRLARGSGWLRVNLDSDFLKTIGKKYEQDQDFELDISDVADVDFYASNEDEGADVGSGSNADEKVKGRRTSGRWNKLSERWLVSRNALEKAVLAPSLEKNFSPTLENEAELEDLSPPELEVGLGVVFSLLGLSAVLFLVNCLPGNLWLGSRSRTRPEGEAPPTIPEEKRRKEEEEATGREEELKGDEEGLKEMEIIC